MNSLLKEDFIVIFNETLYSSNVIARACYSLSDKALFEFRKSDEGFLCLAIKLINNASQTQVRDALAASLIDFTLRREIEEKTHTVRDTIVKAALAELR